MRRALPWLLALGTLCGTSTAAEGMHLGEVAVIGRGEPLRVVVYSGFNRVGRGRRAPYSCDEGERKLIDRMLAPGATASFESADACVCFQRSASRFRRVDLTRPEWACAPRDESGRVSGPIRIAVTVPEN